MQTLLILLGLVLGAAAADGVAGAVLGAVVGWLAARTLKQQREIDALAARWDAAQPAAHAVPPTAAVPRPADGGPRHTPNPQAAPSAAQPDAPAEPEPSTWPAMPASASASASISTAMSPPVPATASAASLPPHTAEPDQPAPPAQPAPGLVGRAVEGLRGWLFGGNTIVKAGVAILFIGLAFLAKYASEQVQLPVELRLAGIAAVALVLLVLGWRLRHTRAGYAQALQGGAVAVLYLTLFSAFKFYGVLGAGAAFALMATVAALAAALAVLQDARALAVIGTTGGYATPLLLASGSGNMVALLSYYLLLGGGVALVAWWRTWRELNLIAFLFTFGVGSAWGVLSYQASDYAWSQGFLVAFFLLFVAVLLLPARRAEAGDGGGGGAGRWVNGSLLFGLPTVAFALQYGLVKSMAGGPAISALVLAGFYVGLARALRGRPALALVFEGSLAVGTVLLTLVIPLALDARSTAGAWALEGAGLLWLGFRQQRRLPRALGYALVVVAGALLMVGIDQNPPPTQLLNPTLLAGLMLLAGALASAWVVQRWAAPPQPAPSASELPPLSERVAEPLLVGWAVFGTLPVLWLHVRWLVEGPWRLAAMLGGLAALALLFTALAARLNWRGVAWPVLGLAPLMLLFALGSIDWQEQPLARGGWWAWPLAGAAQLAALRWAAPHWPASGCHLSHVLGALVPALLGAALGRWALESLAGDDAAASAWPWLGWLALPALALWLLQQPRVLALWPLRTCPEAYARDAAALLSAGALLWVLLANLQSPGGAAPLPYLPFVNPLDLGIALALAAAVRWMRLGAGAPLLARVPAATPSLLGGLGFVWLNAMLVRAFHHLGGVPFTVRDWSASLAVQSGLTLLWSSTALALMWWSARRALRTPWMVGAALLGLVVAKLLLVDLSASGTVTRIVSFIGAGVLMLVIGYVAPLPARSGEARDAKA